MRNIQHHVLLIYMFGCSLLSGSLQFTTIITASSDDNFRSVQLSSSSACRKKATLPLRKGKLVCCGKQGNRGSKLKTQNGAPLWLRLVSESVPLQLGSPCLGGYCKLFPFASLGTLIQPVQSLPTPIFPPLRYRLLYLIAILHYCSNIMQPSEPWCGPVCH